MKYNALLKKGDLIVQYFPEKLEAWMNFKHSENVKNIRLVKEYIKWE